MTTLITVGAGSSSWLQINNISPYVHANQTMMGAGDVKYNTQAQRMEVYTGTNWTPLVGSCEVGLSPATQNILVWAQMKMYEEQKLAALADKYPIIKELKEQLEAAKALVSDV